MDKVTTLKDYLENQDEVKVIDLRTFSSGELSGLVAELSKFDELPSFKLTGIPEDVENNQSSIKKLLNLADWELSEEMKISLREQLKIELWDFASIDYARDSLPETDWITQINLGLDLKSNNVNDRTPALWVTIKNNTKALALMMEKDLSVLLGKDRIGNTPAIIAAKRGYTKILAIMIGKNPEVLLDKDIQGTPAIWAARNGHKDTLKLMIDISSGKVLEDRDDDGTTPAMHAAMHDRAEVLDLIIGEKPTALEEKNNNGETISTLLFHFLRNNTVGKTLPEGVTSEGELTKWLYQKAKTNSQIIQVKSIIKHFRTMGSKETKVEEEEEGGKVNLIDMPSGTLITMAQNFIKSSYPDELLLDIGQVGKVATYFLSKEALQTPQTLQTSLSALLIKLGLDAEATKIIGRFAQEEEGERDKSVSVTEEEKDPQKGPSR